MFTKSTKKIRKESKWDVIISVLDKWTQEKRENWIEVKKLLLTLYMYDPLNTKEEEIYYNKWKSYLLS